MSLARYGLGLQGFCARAQLYCRCLQCAGTCQTVGVKDVTVAYNQECTPAKFKELFRSVGARCQPDDTLLFYYSGHGTCVKDLDGDEDDGMDEAFVLVNDAGEINLDTGLITDDEFVQIMMDAVPQQTTIITISDCCHSGTIMDFIRPVWKDRKAVSISGSRDAQTSGETDTGGICTHSILLAIESLQRQGLQSYHVKKLFKETLVQDETLFGTDQYITMNRSAGCGQLGIPWPLIPKTLYTAPYWRPSLVGGLPPVRHAHDAGDVSRTASTTTAAPADTPAPALQRLPFLHTPVAGLRSTSPKPPEQVNLSMQALLSPPRVQGRGVLPSAGMGTQYPWVASQPPFTYLPNNVSSSVSVPAGARHKSPSAVACRLPGLWVGQ